MSGIAPEAGAERDIRSALPSDDLGDTPVLELRKLDKWFTGTHALKSVDLAFRQGEVHAIIGENGAGKSTLIKLLTGAHTRTSGTILWRGKEVSLDTPHDALALGINAVHQEVGGEERARRGEPLVLVLPFHQVIVDEQHELARRHRGASPGRAARPRQPAVSGDLCITGGRRPAMSSASSAARVAGRRGPIPCRALDEVV